MTRGQLKERIVRSRSRTLATQCLRRRLPTLGGLVLDVGGGRRTLHDDAWPEGTRRLRLDVVPLHEPDVVADVVRLPFVDATFDSVLLSQVLEHLPEPHAAVREIHRVLKPGGVLIGTVPFVFPIHADPWDFHRYTAAALERILVPFGAVEIEPYGNALGGAWTLVSSRSRLLLGLTPLARRVALQPDPQCPEGYLFVGCR